MFYIKNYYELEKIYDTSNLHLLQNILSAYKEALIACDPYNTVLKEIKLDNNKLFYNNKEYNLKYYNNIYLLGAGKATYKMAKAVHKLIGKRIINGCICIPENNGYLHKKIGNIKIIESSHPTPNSNSVHGAEIISKIAKKSTEKDLIIFLLSGGASSLMCMPETGITLEEKQDTNNLLLKCGANISEINRVRKNISRLKGGKLAQLAYPSDIIQIVISDVIGNSLETIGSAPLIADDSTPEKAINILNKYNIYNKVPSSVINYLTKNNSLDCHASLSLARNDGREKIATASPRNDGMGEKINTKIIADNKIALEATKKYLEKNNYKVFIYPTPLTTEATNSAKELFNYLKNILNKYKEPFAVIAGGEPVVTLKNNLSEWEINKKTNGLPRLRLAMTAGKGGRAQELALSMLKNLKEITSKRILFLSAGSDGIDGSTDAAGALVSNFNPNKISNNNEINEYLFCHNSYNYFKNYGGLIKTGYTGTNVNDIFIALVI